MATETMEKPDLGDETLDPNQDLSSKSAEGSEQDIQTSRPSAFLGRTAFEALATTVNLPETDRAGLTIPLTMPSGTMDTDE